MADDSRQERDVRARMPADVDAPDQVLHGLTFRQLAILAVAALGCYGLWRMLQHVVPVPVVLGLIGVCAAAALVVAQGRRDGLPLDLWLLAAVRHSRSPHRLSTTDTHGAIPDWVDPGAGALPLPAPLRLPADAIAEDGRIGLGDAAASIVAATSVNLALRTGDEQVALVEMFGRWLNSLSAPTQIVVSAQPVDLHSAARSLEAAADRLPHPALRAACADHAAFLDALAERRDPLRRQVLVVTRSGAGEPGGRSARRRAEDAVRSLSALGVGARILDGAAATAVLAAAADPYRPARPGALAAPDTVITGPSRAPDRKQES